MGITIHYRGTIDNIGDVDQITRELTDIGTSMKWKVQAINDDWSAPVTAQLKHTKKGATITGNLGLRGVSLHAGKNAESLDFYFDKNGHLCGLFTPVFRQDGDLTEEQASWLSSKTQFAGAEHHAWVVGLLKYVKRRYISDLEVHDEAGYWEKGDPDALRKHFDYMNKLLDRFEKVLNSGILGETEELKKLTPDQLADRIEKLVQDKENEIKG